MSDSRRFSHRDDGDAQPERNDPRVDEIVAEYLDRLNSGEKLEPLEVFSAHPDIADDILRELYAFLDLGSEGGESEPRLGTLGDYTLRRQIGRGGMGIVYEAWESSMGRSVALKVLPAVVAADSKAVARFIQEAQLAGRIQHPNVVSVYGMGVREQTPYYAMELVDGETLAQVLKRTKIEDIHIPRCFELAEAFAGAADGLQHAHSKGITHRVSNPRT